MVKYIVFFLIFVYPIVSEKKTLKSNQLSQNEKPSEKNSVTKEVKSVELTPSEQPAKPDKGKTVIETELQKEPSPIIQKETQVDPKQSIYKESTKEKSAEKKSSHPGEENKYSVQIVLGKGFGFLNVQNDRYDPTTSLSEFVALSLFSASQASPGYASVLSGNLGTNALFGLFLINDEISSSTIHSTSNSSFTRFYLENRGNGEPVGIRFGLSSGNYEFRPGYSRYETSFLPATFFGNTNPIINIYMLQSYIRNSEPIYLGINTFDVALNYHFNPEEKFDPYLGVGTGIGTCFSECYAIRFFGRAGIRYNFSDYYAFIEQEMQMVLFSAKLNRYEPIQERITLFGFGFHL